MQQPPPNLVSERNLNTPPPLVSIIIPCYNAEQYIAESIQSALDQTYPNCEIIVIDDGSTDNSLEVIKSFGNRIRWETGYNRGGCAARNRGLRLAKGEWIQFLDADDLISADKIATQIKYARKFGVKIAGSALQRFTGNFKCNETVPNTELLFIINGIEYAKKKYLGELNSFINPTGDIKLGTSLMHCWLIHTSIIDSVGTWNENLSSYQDSEYFNRMYLTDENILHLNTVKSFYRVDVNNSVSKSRSSKSADASMIYTRSVKKILDHDNTLRSRIAVARVFFNEAKKYYPTHKVTAKKAIHEAKMLSVPISSLTDSCKSKIAIKLFGIKNVIIIMNIHQRLIRIIKHTTKD